MLCQEEAAAFAARLPEIRAVGAVLALIGNGRADQAAAFRDHFGLSEVPLFTDPSRATYRTAGFRRGVRHLVTARSLKNYARAFRAGFREGKIQGDPLQMGGAVALDPAGRLLWQHVAAVAGDLADPGAALAALRGGVGPDGAPAGSRGAKR